MSMDGRPRAAIVRTELAMIEHVTRTWFEWEYTPEEPDGLKTLVVEVNFDTDPNAYDPAWNTLARINDVVQRVLTEQTTMTVHRMRIVPASPPQCRLPIAFGSGPGLAVDPPPGFG